MADLNKLQSDLSVIDTALNNGQAGVDTLNLARDRGNDLAVNNEVIQDRNNLTPFEFVQKYGAETAMKLDRIDNARSNASPIQQKTDREAFNDSVLMTGNAALTGVESIAGFGAGLLSPELGTRISQGIQAQNDLVNNNLSDTQQRSDYIASQKALLDNQDNENRYQTDLNNDSPLVAGLKKIGRDAVSSGTRLTEDPLQIERGTSEAVGSLLTAGPVGKALSTVGKTVLKREIAKDTTTTLAIGALEGGGAYTQNVNDVMGMSHEELMKGSSDYQSLIAQGVSPDVARRQIANTAGLEAGLIQAPIAAATGRLVAKFEGNPLASVPLREAAGNVAREGIEEGIQSTTGQIAQNYAKQVNADSNQSLTEGVGDQLVQGAVFGSLSAGATSSVGLSAAVASDAINSLGSKVKTLSENIQTKLDDNINGNDKTSPISARNVAVDVNNAANSVPDVINGLNELTPDIAPEVKEQVFKKIADAVTITDSDLQSMPEIVRNELPEQGANKLDAILGSAAIAADNTATKDERTAAGLYIINSIGSNQELFNKDIPEFLTGIDQNHPAYETIQNFQTQLSRMELVPQIVEAMNWARSSDAKQEATNNITPVVINNSVGLSTENPTAINSETAKNILYQADRGDIELNDSQKAAIRNASGIVEVQSNYEQQKQDLNIPDAIDIVSKNITTDSVGSFKSLSDHIKDINKAIINNDAPLIRQRAYELNLFAHHMKNKVQALINSYTNNGETTDYKKLGPNYQWLDKGQGKSVYFRRNSVGSIKLAKQVLADATAVISMANTVNGVMPQQGFKDIKVPDLLKVIRDAETRLSKSKPNVVPSEARTEPSESQPEGKVQTEEKSTSEALKPSDRKSNSNWQVDIVKEENFDYYDLSSKNIIITAQEFLKDKAKRIVIKDFIATLGNKQQPYLIDPDGKLWSLNYNDWDHTGFLVDAFQATHNIKAFDNSIRITTYKDQVGMDVIGSYNPLPQQISMIKAIQSAALRQNIQVVLTEKLEKFLNNKLPSNEQVIEEKPASKALKASVDENTSDGSENISKPETWNNILVYTNYFDDMSAGDIKINLVSDNTDMYQFHIITSKGEKIAGTYNYNDHESWINNFVITSENGSSSVGGSVIRYIAKQIIAKHPKALGVHGTRQSGARGNEYFELYFKIKDGRLIPTDLNILTEIPSNNEIFDPISEQVIKDELVEREGKANRRAEEARQKIIEDEKANQEDKIQRRNRESESVSKSEPEIEDLHSDLIVSKGLNMFKRAFTKKKVSTKIAQMKNPLRQLKATLETTDSIIDQIGHDTEYEVNSINVEGVEQLIGIGNEIKKVLISRLKTQLTKPNTKGVTLDSRILNDTDFNRFESFRALNILDKTPNGVRYNSNLLESAILASLDWVINNTLNYNARRKEDIALEENIEADSISQNELDVYNRGSTVDFVKQDLTQYILRYWGVQSNNDEYRAYTIGIAEGIAAELIHGLTAQELIKHEEIPLMGKMFNKIYFDERPDDIKDVLNRINGAEDLIADLSLIEKEPSYFIGSAPTKVSHTQLRNPLTSLTKSQTRALKAAQNTPFYVNIDMHNLIKDIGLRNFVNMMGGDIDIDPNTINKNYYKTVKGKNLTLSNSFEDMLKHITRVQNHTNGKHISEIPTYFKHDITKVGRFNMVGRFNPVADKLAREVLSATKSTLNLTKKEDRDRFYMTIAQGLGIKTERSTRTEIVASTLKKLEDYSDIIDDLVNYLNGSQLPDDIATRISDKMGNDLSLHGIHGLLAIAKWNIARENGTDTAFEHYSYLEADGKTNGPINALVLFTAGKFEQSWANLVAKGGLFLGSKKTMAQQYKDDGIDLYETVSNKLVQYLKINDDFINDAKSINYKDDKIIADGILEQKNAVYDILNKLNIDFRVTEKGLEIKRGIAKNPLTITIYGSGVNGINTKFTKELIDAIYKAMGDNPELISSIDNSIELLRTKKAIFSESKGRYFIFKASEKDGLNNGNYENGNKFTFSERDFNVIAANIKTFFIKPLATAIQTEVTHHVSDTTRAVQQATQVQSIVLTAMFRNEIIANLYDKAINPSKYPNYRKGDGLSENEIQAIFKKLTPYAPFIKSEYQNFFIAGNQVAKAFDAVTINNEKITFPSRYSTAIDGSFTSPAYLYGPALAGVKAAPILTIGSGDGLMMQFFMSAQKAPTDVLTVFDGLYMPAHKIEEYGNLINKDVFRTWTENNPVYNVNEAFTKFIRKDAFKYLFNDENILNTQSRFTRLELAKTLFNVFPKNKEEEDALLDNIKDAELISEVNTLSQNLQYASRSIEARQKVLSKTNISVDQMAGSENPHINKGTLNTLEEMNAEYDRLMNEVTEPASQEEGLTITSTNSIKYLAKKIMPNLNKEQADIFETATGLLAEAGYNIIIGSQDELIDYEFNNYPDTFDPSEPNYKGKIDVDNKIIYSTNTDETLLHELIHAVTLEKTIAYYKGNKLSKVDQDAFACIEILMNEWMNLNFDHEGLISTDPLQAMNSTISYYLNNGEKALALNEFMAWSLSNSRIIREQKKTTIKNPLLRIAKDVLDYLKTLIWGSAKITGPNNKIHENLKFNTQIIMSSRNPSIMEDTNNLVAYQSYTFGSNNYLTDLRKYFADNIINYLKSSDTKVTRLARKADAKLSRIESEKLSRDFISNGWNMNMQEKSTFNMIHASLMLNHKLNSAALSRVEDLYKHVIDNIDPSTFIDNPNDPVSIAIGEDRYNVLTGQSLKVTDIEGRSSLMSSFLTLAMVHPEFRTVLSKIALPKGAKSTQKGLDGFLTDLGTSSMNELGSWLSGDRGSKNVTNSIDNLVNTITDTNADQRSFIEQKYGDSIDGFEGYIADNIQKLSKNVYDKADTIQTNNKFVKLGANLTKLVAGAINEEISEAALVGTTRALNNQKWSHTLREIINEFIGRTKENAPIFDMISHVRSIVQRTRQQFRNDLPPLIQSKFTRKLSDIEWSALHTVLGKTDIGALYNSFGINDTIKYLTDTSERNRMLAKLEVQINNQFMLNKASQLAKFMITGEHGKDLLRNAYAITNLGGDLNKQQLVDQYVSLMAIKETNKDIKNIIAELLTNETDGIKYALHYLVDLRNTELTKVNSSITRMNHYKGYIPSENQLGTSLIVAEDTEFARLSSMGYERLGPYEGSTADIGHNNYSYYFTPVSGLATYNQGVLQTVHQTASGIDPRNGFTTNGLTAGRITEPRAINAIKSRLPNSKNTKENLLPIYDDKGKVVAYERATNPAMAARLNRNTNLSQMIGAWRGRQIEEEFAKAVNIQLIDNLYDIYTEGLKANRLSEFVDIRNSKDPVDIETYRIIPPETKEYIKSLWGDHFYVQRDMRNDALGYRAASVGDFWTGNSRFNPQLQNAVNKTIRSMLGNKGYRIFVNAENLLQTFVTEAKQLIVVKSVIVPAANLVSNIFQLAHRGVPFRAIIHGLGSKTNEINIYIQRRSEQVRLEADLTVAKGENNTIKIKTIENKIQSLKDSYKRLTIWPLIKAGEFTSISDGGVTQEDLAISNGKWSEYIEKFADKLPTELQTTYRYALLTKDTALFKGLARTVQYGDFISKAILYEDLINRKKLSEKDALAIIGEEYVNYNKLSGRVRDTFDSIGLTWFWKFKIRAMKTGVNMLRRNPLRSLMMMHAAPSFPIIGSIGTPVTDNFLAVMADGKLGWSIGPGMGLNSPWLSPWLNIIK